MHPKHIVTLMAAGLATLFVATRSATKSIAATGGDSAATLDSDGDFLPDAVEWVVLTNAQNGDTDGDQVPDFVEVVEAGHPRHESAPLPPDQQMRLIITGPSPASPDPRTWMHIFHRVMTSQTGEGAGVSAIESFDTWLEGPLWPGVQFPLNSFASGEMVYRERVTPNDGVWVQLSIPLVSKALLTAVLPCTIWAESSIGGQQLASGQNLINAGGEIATLVPYEAGRYVFQTLSPTPPSGFVGESNRVCVLELVEQTSGPAGTTYQVVDADCEDANELECSASCQASIGWVITIPGGTELIGGQ
tara:strand:- start:8063 stop:8974 length:912 start_codon:yes stop_codon:yes gene_type:complete